VSIVKSSVINLYDGVSGEHHFQAKVSSDRVDLQIPTLPLVLKGTSISLTNVGGSSVDDVVGTILNTIQSVTDEVNARIADVQSEKTLRTSADADLQTAINQEASDRVAALNAETLVRVAAENALGVKIVEEKSAREAAITSEIGSRSAADTVLQTNITAEATGRIASDDTLQSNLNSETASRVAAGLAELTARSSADATLQSNIDAEALSRETRDTVLQTNITDATVALQSAITAEETSRIASDAVLQTAVDDEKDLRVSADAVLQTNINNAIAARITAVSNEATARSNADNILSTSIATEQNARLAEVAGERARIDSLLDGTTIDLNQLKELITAYTTSDSDILSQISIINSTLVSIQGQLDGTDSTLLTLLANIAASEPPPSPPAADFRVNSRSHSNGRYHLQMTNLDGTLISNEECSALVGRQFTIGDHPTVFTFFSVTGNSQMSPDAYDEAVTSTLPNDIYLVPN
jgi:hypothetical protein